MPGALSSAQWPDHPTGAAVIGDLLTGHELSSVGGLGQHSSLLRGQTHGQQSRSGVAVAALGGQPRSWGDGHTP